jgi:membrane-associated phospholipid phosphatase
MPTLLTNIINPLTVLLLLAAPFLTRRRTGVFEFWIRSILGIGLAVILAESGKKYEVWHGHPSFPSGHETFCLAAVTCLASRDLRWLAAGLPLALLMAWALVTAHYHTPIDILGALLTGPLPALLCQQYKRPPHPRGQPLRRRE